MDTITLYNIISNSISFSKLIYQLNFVVLTVYKCSMLLFFGICTIQRNQTLFVKLQIDWNSLLHIVLIQTFGTLISKSCWNTWSDATYGHWFSLFIFGLPSTPSWRNCFVFLNLLLNNISVSNQKHASIHVEVFQDWN